MPRLSRYLGLELCFEQVIGNIDVQDQGTDLAEQGLGFRESFPGIDAGPATGGKFPGAEALGPGGGRFGCQQPDCDGPEACPRDENKYPAHGSKIAFGDVRAPKTRGSPGLDIRPPSSSSRLRLQATTAFRGHHP